nr:uncharacterized protein LOC113391535 [Vanessa tameamea]
MSLPDSCAELLLSEPDAPEDREGGGEWEGRANTSASRSDIVDDCCRSGSGSLRCASGGASTNASLDNQRAGTCRRELPARPLETHHRSGSWSRARLSAAVPDVAMAPNANTHLLTARDYPHPHPHPHPHPAHPHPHPHPAHQALHGAELVGVLQLDLGDGATHTPRPGSRAQRAARQHREHSQGGCARRDSDELRAAIELSVMRAYSSLQVARRGPPQVADLLPPPDFAAGRSRASPSPSALSAPASARGECCRL